MTESEIIKLAIAMRSWQRKYFAAARDSSEKLTALKQSKALESQFDKAAAEFERGQGNLL
jgi:hypothetical protein